MPNLDRSTTASRAGLDGLRTIAVVIAMPSHTRPGIGGHILGHRDLFVISGQPDCYIKEVRKMRESAARAIAVLSTMSFALINEPAVRSLRSRDDARGEFIRTDVHPDRGSQVEARAQVA